ncbi:MAG: hypothetical protein DWQ08_08080 [Proteobacteria bacterium]|nr:MAG: hypothetical protein DWQ08_08080 [Pseudomonadota bacterium]
MLQRHQATEELNHDTLRILNLGRECQLQLDESALWRIEVRLKRIDIDLFFFGIDVSRLTRLIRQEPNTPRERTQESVFARIISNWLFSR